MMRKTLHVDSCPHRADPFPLLGEHHAQSHPHLMLALLSALPERAANSASIGINLPMRREQNVLHPERGEVDLRSATPEKYLRASVPLRFQEIRIQAWLLRSIITN